MLQFFIVNPCLLSIRSQIYFTQLPVAIHWTSASFVILLSQVFLIRPPDRSPLLLKGQVFAFVRRYESFISSMSLGLKYSVIFRLRVSVTRLIRVNILSYLFPTCVVIHSHKWCFIYGFRLLLACFFYIAQRASLID